MGYFRSNIDAMSGYQPGEQPEQMDRIIKLNTNENPFPPSQAVLKAICSLDADKLRRYCSPTAKLFIEAAAPVLGVSEDMILAGNGSDDLLTIAFRSFLGQGDAVVFNTPSYSLYPVLAQLQDARQIIVPFAEDYRLPEMIIPGAKLTIVCNPNAPSGTWISPQQLGQLAKQIDGVLLIDEAYVDFAEQSCIEHAMTYPNVLVLRSMSKGYSLAGVRFGFAVANPDLIEGMSKVKDSYNTDVISQAAAAAAIRDQDYHQDCVQQIRTERTRLDEALRSLGFEVWPSVANFVLVRVGKPKAANLFSALKQRGIYVRYFNEPQLDDCLRITVGLRKQTDALIEALREDRGEWSAANEKG